MRITIDTNILLSATFWLGDSHKIIEKAENKEIEIILSKDIIEEFMQVLEYKEIRDKIKNKNLETIYTIEKILTVATLIEPTEKIDIIKEDPTDNKILECASAGKAEYIITNDKHILKLKKYKNIKIQTPKEFLNKI